MGQTLEQFAAECHDILKSDPGSQGLEKVRRRLERVLVDPEFVATYLGPEEETPRKVIYEDPELGFCILSHVHKGGSDGARPHDHGPSWAIYGQAAGTTVMTEYSLVSPPGNGEAGKVKELKRYELKPGMAVAYRAGQLHAPRRTGDTRLIRIEGMNMEKVKRDRFELV